jgi:hypothetical protein
MQNVIRIMQYEKLAQKVLKVLLTSMVMWSSY